MALGDYQAFVQVGAVHQSRSFSSDAVLEPGQQLYSLPPFTSYSAAVGAGKDGWLVQFYGENLTDARAQLYANYFLYYKAVTVSRPRTLGVRLSYRLGP